jgi:hypothetical protein
MKTRYYTCYFPDLKALQFAPGPETWGNITGMADLDDEALADLSWAGYPDHGFLTEAAAVKRGITAESMAAAKDIGGQVEMIPVREQRDVLLTASDAAVLPDRWAGYSKAQRQEWTDYRAALRDFPSTVADPFNITWPTAPN